MEWPLFGLTVRCGPVVLRPITDGDLDALTDLLPDDVELDPRRERFGGLGDVRDRRRRFAQGVWHSRGAWSPTSWCLDLGVAVDGALVGLQTLEADDFAVLRTVDSASWLIGDARGLGIGTAMRQAVLGLAFDHLGAVAAITSAVQDNASSLGVSRRLGYTDNGVSSIDTVSGVAQLQHLRLTHDGWQAARPHVEVSGLAPCLLWFGV